LQGYYCGVEPQKAFFQNSSEISSYSFLGRAMTISDFISLEFTRNEILLLCSHRDNFKCVSQRLDASFKNNPITFRNFKIMWCRSWFKLNVQISFTYTMIDWFYSISLNLYSKYLDYLIELEGNRKNTRQFGALHVKYFPCRRFLSNIT